MLPHVGMMMKQIRETLIPQMNILKLSFSYMDYIDSQFHVSQMLSLIYSTLVSVACPTFLSYLLV